MMVLKTFSEESNPPEESTLERPPVLNAGMHDTDSETDGEVDVENNNSGYVLLPQSIEASGSDSEEDFPQLGDGGYMLDLAQPPHEWIPSKEDLKPTENRDLKLDEEQIEKIKTAMAGINLPPASQPGWASQISEEQWNLRLQKLLHKQRAESTQNS